MGFGWINFYGALLVFFIMIPNIIYAIKTGNNTAEEVVIPMYLTICEQIGRYGCIVLMWFPVFVWKFGFRSVEELMIYFLLNCGLLIAYYLVWVRYFRKKTLRRGMALAIIPTMIFLVSGLLLRHWTLVVFAAVFGVAHGRITYLTHRES